MLPWRERCSMSCVAALTLRRFRDRIGIVPAMKRTIDASRVPNVIRLAGLICVIVAAAVAPAVAQAAPRPFTKRFGTNVRGDIAIASNTLMTCTGPAPGSVFANCPIAQADTSAGTVANPLLNNNEMTMGNVSVDPARFGDNSSTAKLNMPAGSTVLFAGLYWTGTTPASMTDCTTTGPSASVRILGPGDSAVTSLQADVYDPDLGPEYGYSCFKDVTSFVLARGAGDYTVGNVPTKTGWIPNGLDAGWSLVVAYQDNTQPLRNLTVFDGQQGVTGALPPVTIPVSGFITPATGPVKTKLGMITLEGDRGTLGDSAKLNSTTLTDALSPPNNFFNATIADLGVATSGRNPSYGNQLGFDSTIIDASGILANGATSANIGLSTTSDAYMPIVSTFVTDLYSPDVSITKTVCRTDPSAECPLTGNVAVGDTLEYSITVGNSGDDGAANSVIKEAAMPPNTAFVGGSVLVDGVAPASSLVDAPADGGTGALTVRLGTGADATNGGLIAKGESHVVKFKVKVTGYPGDLDPTIKNTATIDYTAQTLGTALSDDADVTVTVDKPVPPVIPAKIKVLIRTPRKPVRLGATVRLPVTVTTLSSGTAKNVETCARVPANVRYVSSTGKYKAGRVCWPEIPSLASGASRTWYIKATTSRIGRRLAHSAAIGSNAARVTSQSPLTVFDPRPAIFTG